MDKDRPFPELVLRTIRRHGLIEQGDRVLVAVSGGPDSVALLHILFLLRELLGMDQITVAHFDHQLRGEASAGDKAFVESLAQRLGLPFQCGSADVYMYRHEHRVSLEMAARACRHRFFSSALELSGANKLTLGHTANDQAEEVLLRLIRGTGPSGAAGMAPKTHRGIIRPLLFATRLQILSYLSMENLPFREDASNLDSFCQRNALRLEVLPLLEKHFHGRVVETVARHSQLVRDEESYWDHEVYSRWTSICSQDSPEEAAPTARLVLKIPELLKLHPALRRRTLRFALGRVRGHLMGIYAVHVEAISQLIQEAGTGKILHLPEGLQAVRNGKSLVFSQRPSSSDTSAPKPVSRMIVEPGRYEFPDFHLEIHLTELWYSCAVPPIAVSCETARVDADAIQWPLEVRYWKPGDRFRPLGLGGSKKLQDFFTDTHVPHRERHTIPLLCDREKICWIMGHRLDDRVKITPATRRTLIIERRSKDP